MTYKPKILVVEPDAAALRQLEAALKVLGAEPRCLPSGKKAAEIINKEKFDGAFLTWESTEMSGEELTERIRKSKSNAKIPIAMLTGGTNSKALAAGFKAGVTFFLSKPVGPKELQRLLGATSGPMIEERLRYHRAPLGVPVSCAWGDKKITGQGIDISVSGLLGSLSGGPEVGTEVQLEFTLPRAPQPLQLKGSVARSGPGPRVGVKFSKLTPEQKEQLKSFVDRHVTSLPAAR